MMNIVYSASDSYAELCGISILSLLENNKVERINIYIIDNGISKENKNSLVQTVKNYSQELIFVNKVDLESLTKTKIYVGRWNIGTFFRLYLGSILPLDVKRVLYIDCDTIIRHSLRELYDLDLENFIVAGVDDCRSDLYRIEIGCNPGTVYINNGVMLIDLKRWREYRVEEKFTEFISDRKGNCTYMDQAPLNGILGSRGLIFELPAKYNAQRIFFDFSYEELLRLRKPEHHLNKDEYNIATSDPIIVHFTPVFITGTRPWQVKDNHPFVNEYRKYKEMSLWANIPYRKDDRKIAKKIMTIICKLTPRRLMIKVMSFLHATWYPKKRMKIYMKKRDKIK